MMKNVVGMFLFYKLKIKLTLGNFKKMTKIKEYAQKLYDTQKSIDRYTVVLDNGYSLEGSGLFVHTYTPCGTFIRLFCNRLDVNETIITELSSLSSAPIDWGKLNVLKNCLDEGDFSNKDMLKEAEENRYIAYNPDTEKYHLTGLGVTLVDKLPRKLNSK